MEMVHGAAGSVKIGVDKKWWSPAAEGREFDLNPGSLLPLDAWKDYLTIHFTNRKQVQVKQTISAIENMLSEHMFLRVHRSYIVSLNKISGYNSTSLRLGGTEIPIGRLYKLKIHKDGFNYKCLRN